MNLRSTLRRLAGEYPDLLAIVTMLLIAGVTMLEIWKL
jgi:hypothetical protein